MTRVVAHDLNDVDIVRASLERAYREHADRLSAYAPTLTWNDSRSATVSVTVMTKTIRADFTIDERNVRVESRVPFVFSYLEGKALSRLCERLEEIFAEARAEHAGG
jgi:hypothetical protein